jgi:hypothetical protein
MMVVGIDPGLGCTGLAIHDTECGWWTAYSIRSGGAPLVSRANYIASEIKRITPPIVDLLVVELPQVYQGHLQIGDPNDLIKLSVLVGSVCATINHRHAMLPLPREWKGQVPKKIHHKRIREEVPGLGRISKDAMDAVGLALYGKRIHHA